MLSLIDYRNFSKGSNFDFNENRMESSIICQPKTTMFTLRHSAAGTLMHKEGVTDGPDFYASAWTQCSKTK